MADDVTKIIVKTILLDGHVRVAAVWDLLSCQGFIEGQTESEIYLTAHVYDHCELVINLLNCVHRS